MAKASPIFDQNDLLNRSLDVRYPTESTYSMTMRTAIIRESLGISEARAKVPTRLESSNFLCSDALVLAC
jgi:hypothetical protein